MVDKDGLIQLIFFISVCVLFSGFNLPTDNCDCFAYYGHNRPQEDGMYRSPKKIAEAMGHEYETHLLSYARFDSKDLAKSFDQVPLSQNLIYLFDNNKYHLFLL